MSTLAYPLTIGGIETLWTVCYEYDHGATRIESVELAEIGGKDERYWTQGWHGWGGWQKASHTSRLFWESIAENDQIKEQIAESGSLMHWIETYELEPTNH